ALFARAFPQTPTTRVRSGRTKPTPPVTLFLDNGKQVVDLLFSGVLPRFPRLRFISVESGIGFIPFVLEACDYAFDYSRVWEQRREFTQKPSEYFARQVYSCFWFEEHAQKRMLDLIGE